MYTLFEGASGGAAPETRPSEIAMENAPMGRLAGNQAAIRALDIVIALLALIWLAPLLALVALLVKSADGGPILFRQPRVGRNGEMFRCLKFRTMVMDAEARLADLLDRDPQARIDWERDHKLRDDPRIIPFGAFLRKWSLDELPQFVNVLRGEMGIVGPRPIVPAEIRRYGRYFANYTANRPGITGLWQVSGRSDTSYRRRVACDVVYARSKSLRTDIRIIFMTAIVVLSAKGSY